MTKRHSDVPGTGVLTAVKPSDGGQSPPYGGGSELDVQKVRGEFPILSTTAHGKPLIYLDNGATTQKPRGVIDAVRRYYESQNANIHRGVYELSQVATTLYEQARLTVQKFINAAHSE